MRHPLDHVPGQSPAHDRSRISFKRDQLIWRAGIIMSLALVLAGCGQPNTYQAPPPPDVQVSLPRQSTVTSYVEVTGTTQASERVELHSRVKGFLVERKFEDGALVNAGQLLFVIDEEPFKVRLQYAQAKANEAEANLKKAQESKAREIAKAQLTVREAQLALAETDHERRSNLLAKQASSKQEFDQSTATLNSAKAQLLSARAEVEQAEVNYSTGLLSATAALKLAQSEVRTAELDLEYCRIVAPISGRIDRRTFDIGNYITTDASTPLASIVRVDPIYAYAAVNESDLLKIKKRYSASSENQAIPVQMSLGDQRDFSISGTIDYIAPTVLAGTGTVQIRGVFKNSGLIIPGMFVRFRIPSEELPDAILVSERSLGYDQSGAYVYVVNAENVIERRLVVPGDHVDSHRVVQGELKANEQVISDGLLKVRPGLKVNPKLPEPPPPTADKATSSSPSEAPPAAPAPQ
ncbi:MAG: efflux RND transporter periplasmic adaptor subunit [Planctomycetaceae bacterium]